MSEAKRSNPFAISCACPRPADRYPVSATSFGSIGALLPVDADGFVEIAVSMTRDGSFDPDAIA
jgi:hypothetical protein